jgi:hypothetical protein
MAFVVVEVFSMALYNYHKWAVVGPGSVLGLVAADQWFKAAALEG